MSIKLQTDIIKKCTGKKINLNKIRSLNKIINKIPKIINKIAKIIFLL